MSMKIVVIGDIVVSSALLTEAARQLDHDADVEVVDWSHSTRQEFQRAAQHIEHDGPDAERIPADAFCKVADTDIILTHFCPITAKLIESAPQVRLIGTCRGGVEHVDVAAASAHGIPVIHCIRNAEATSDFTIWLMLAETRNIVRGHASLKTGQWRKEYPNSGYTTSLCEMTLGIAGLGHIGKLVAKKAAGLGMTVLARDPFVSAESIESLAEPVTLVGKEELFCKADVITLHLRLNSATEGLVDKSAFEQMKPNAYLINTSRAGVIDREAFIDALQQRRIGGAALDVFWSEPLDENDPLLTLDNLTVTPHNAGNVVDALPKSPMLLAATILDYWDSGNSQMVVNFRELNINHSPDRITTRKD